MKRISRGSSLLLDIWLKGGLLLDIWLKGGGDGSRLLKY